MKLSLLKSPVANIRLGRECRRGENALAYHKNDCIKLKKVFIVSASIGRNVRDRERETRDS
jgi:hypothetical protein